MSVGTSRSVYVLTSHPHGDSLTMHLVQRIVGAVEAAGGSARWTNLYDVAFDPVFGDVDLRGFRKFVDSHVVSAPDDVRVDQQILNESTDVVFVFPVHWWSMPAQLKGWIDRVLTGGWAWGATRLGRPRNDVARLTAHVVAITGTDQANFESEGYDWAMRTQIQKGIFAYCGFGGSTWSYVWDPGRATPDAVESDVRAAITRIVG